MDALVGGNKIGNLQHIISSREVFIGPKCLVKPFLMSKLVKSAKGLLKNID